MRQPQRVVETGSIRDNIKVIEILNKFHIEPSGKKRQYILVQCDCGNQFEMLRQYFWRNYQGCKNCEAQNGQINSKVFIGDVFDQLTVIKFAPKGSKYDGEVLNKKRAICKCSCGNIKLIKCEILSTNKTNNCGCQPRGGYQGYEGLSATIYYRIRRNAEVREIPFNVTKEYIWNIYQKQKGKCALTGLNIHLAVNIKTENIASLDRINSSIGYQEGNVQWVHKRINVMKMDLTQEEFISWCRLVASSNK